MGRIKTASIKVMGNQIIKEHGKLFTDNFEKNKEVLDEVREIKSKKIKNILAGYITKEIKRMKKSGL
ncbi:MAG: 30S ribosomal protein S17e [Candidatus Aenigmarchaeota archaeon]|nr:30S ribosomal protein S17e [Candidatus Aenigmarchaeota archaeon]NIP39912.1 30S ribosomal protein S17e [Candidatus Aenigmarchaeota archaeon]NIQ17631.1 30S ribosomal protein S17e [Candidatus Aenigmarchaeota archaeon]NIS72819.1 30S ribosomal protein S17e [Candidatus Aenigmarchaeota archaeon]